MPHHNSPHAQLPLRSLRTTEPILEDFATSATISYLPANRSVPTVVKGWKDYASQGAQQWERHRDIIKSLYIDERKGLKDVMEIMKLDHGFVATPKMYKTRLTRWGYFKNSRKANAKPVSQARKGKEAAAMPPESQADEINPSLEISFSSRKKSATLPTMACWKPPIRPYAIRMPDKYRVPSHIFSCISTYMWGSYDSGRRTSTELASAAFYEYALSQSSAELITSIRSLASFLQAEKYRQAGPLMRLAALQMEDVLRTEPVDLLTCLLEINLELQLSAPELVKSLMRYSADMAKVHFKFPEHPVRILTHQLATLDCTEVAAEAYAVQLKVWQDIRDSSFGRVGDSMAIGCVWITGLGVAAGFQDLPSRLIPRLDDLTLRMAAAMKGSTWCEELFQSYAGSGNIQLFANNSSGEAVKISMQLPGKPTEMVSTQPVARYKLAHLNARCQHFAAEERSQQEAMEAKWLLATDMGSFFVRIMGAIQEWLAEIKEHSLAAAVTRYREKFAAAGLVDIEDYVTGSIGKPT